MTPSQPSKPATPHTKTQKSKQTNTTKSPTTNKPLTKQHSTTNKTSAQNHTTQPHKLPTKTQTLILEYLYTYRFLNIGHIQSFLNHKQKFRIQTWLNDLLEKKYIHRNYERTSLLSVTTPAVYYFATEGIRHLRSLNKYYETELRNRYYDKTRTSAFIDHSLLMADICIDFYAGDTDKKTFNCLLQSDYSRIDDSEPEAPYLQELQPHLFMIKETAEEDSRYILEHMHARLPHARLRERLKKLLTYAAYEWTGDNPAPTVLILCDELSDLIYVKRRVRYLLRNHFEDDDLDVRVSTTAALRSEGARGEIWEGIYLTEDE